MNTAVFTLQFSVPVFDEILVLPVSVISIINKTKEQQFRGLLSAYVSVEFYRLPRFAFMQIQLLTAAIDANEKVGYECILKQAVTPKVPPQ